MVSYQKTKIMTEEKINITAYSYHQGVKLEIEGKLLMTLLNILNQVKQMETKEFSPTKKPIINKGEIIYQGVTMDELYTQNLQLGLTELGVDATGVQLVLENIHAQAIKDGRAVKNEDIGQFKL